MAKGDHSRMQDQINNQGTTMQNSQNALMNTIYGQNVGFQNNYNTGVGMDLGSYNNIMGQYNDFYSQAMNGGVGTGGGGGGGMGSGAGNEYGLYSDLANNGAGYSWDPMFYGAMGNAISGFQNFADTGGFSKQDIQDLRARAISPTRAVYANAQNNLNQNRQLQQFSPNYAAATAKMARDLSYGISDANVDANASIAQMVQQGKLAGLQGLTAAGSSGQGLSNQLDQINLSGKLAGLSGMTGIDQFNAAQRSASNYQNAALALGALNGMTNLYGTTPALANTFGNQLLQSSNQLLQGQGYQNQIGNILINGQAAESGVPGNFSQAMGGLGSVMSIAGPLVGSYLNGGGGFGGGGGSSFGSTGGTDFGGGNLGGGYTNGGVTYV